MTCRMTNAGATSSKRFTLDDHLAVFELSAPVPELFEREPVRLAIFSLIEGARAPSGEMSPPKCAQNLAAHPLPRFRHRMFSSPTHAARLRKITSDEPRTIVQPTLTAR